MKMADTSSTWQISMPLKRCVLGSNNNSIKSFFLEMHASNGRITIQKRASFPVILSTLSLGAGPIPRHVSVLGGSSVKPLS